MKLTLLFLSAFLIFSIWPQAASTQSAQKPEELAQTSAQSWLALADAGNYPQTWEDAAQYFKQSVSKDRWVEMIKAVRSPLGPVQSRKLRSARYVKTLPGAPGGEYVVIHYDTSFQNKQSAVETITPMLEKEGGWRVSGYYIK